MGVIYNYRMVEKKWEAYWKEHPDAVVPDSGYPFSCGRRGRESWPTELVADYGLDVLYLYELFKSDSRQETDWDDGALEGLFRYLGRVWRMALAVSQQDRSGMEEKTASALLEEYRKEITAAKEQHKPHTVVARLMECEKKMRKLPQSQAPGKEEVSAYVRLLLPYAPHIASEILSSEG